MVADAGVVDDATIHVMKMPRCGVKDVQSMGSIARRRKRYAQYVASRGKNSLFNLVHYAEVTCE